MPGSDKNSLFDGSESDGSGSFIVEDDGAGLAALPVEFSMESHQDLSHNFKKIFQFFVHIAVHPPIERHEFMEMQMKSQSRSANSHFLNSSILLRIYKMRCTFLSLF